MSRKIYLPVIGVWEDIDDVTLLNGVPKVASDGSLVDSSGAPVSVAATARFPSVAVSGASISLTSAHIGCVVAVTTGASDSAVTLPTTATDGDVLIIRKADVGAGKVNAGSNIAWLMTADDVVQLAYNSGAWRVLYRSIAPIRQTYSATGAYILPPLAVTVTPRLIAASGGGGSGRRGAAGSLRCGGGGAQAGNFVERTFKASDIGPALTSVPVSIGAKGSGALAVTTDSTNGSAGTNGGTTSFGTFLSALGSTAGAGGTNASGVGGATNAGGTIHGPNGGSASTSGGSGVAPTTVGAITSAGASGGGITTGNAAAAGAVSRTAGNLVGGSAVVAGGSAGTSGGGNGGDGASQPAGLVNGFAGGAGGGSGGSSVTGDAGAGGAGGWPGGGGGGGGASVDGVGNSGAGGDGADGAAEVLTTF